jgi:DNA-binding MltR family transcriptional regulator
MASKGSRGVKKPSLHTLSREALKGREAIDAYFKELESESDRAVALIASSLVDHALVDLIRTKLIELTEPEVDDLFYERHSTLGTFSNRIDVAYALGLIDKSEYDDLNIIRRIRNTFAHAVKYISFKHDLISAECQKMSNKTHSKFPAISNFLEQREIYIDVVHNIYSSFHRALLRSAKRTIAAQKRKMSTLSNQITDLRARLSSPDKSG